MKTILPAGEPLTERGSQRGSQLLNLGESEKREEKQDELAMSN